MGKSNNAIVIGAGLAGLATSLALARSGLNPILLEAGETVGGCCSTVDRQGFTFNNGAVYVAAPSLLRAAFARLALDFDQEVELVDITRPHASYLDDGTVVRLSSTEGSSVEGERAAERSAQLRDGLDDLQRRWAPVYRTLVREVLPFEPSPLRTFARLWRYLPRLAGPADRMIAHCFRDPGLQAAVASTLLYTGMAPERIPATQIIGLVALLEEGFHLPRAGLGAISAALHRALLRQGACIRCAARVERIEVSDGAVSGVTLAGGERIEAQCVVASCSAFEVIQRLLPAAAVPRALRRRAQRAPLSHRAISIQVGCSLRAPPDAFTVSQVPPMREQGRLHVGTPGVPRWFAYTCPTLVVPQLAPPGRTIIELFAPATGIASVGQWRREMTRPVVDSYLAALQSRLPGLTIEALRILDPRDFAADRHLHEGALYGIAPGATPNKFFPHRAPLRGLYLTGQTTFPGFGVPSVILSGIQTADAVIGDSARRKHV